LAVFQVMLAVCQVCWLPNRRQQTRWQQHATCLCKLAGCPSGLSEWLRGWPVDSQLIGVDRISVDTLVVVVCLGVYSSDVRIQANRVTNQQSHQAKTLTGTVTGVGLQAGSLGEIPDTVRPLPPWPRRAIRTERLFSSPRYGLFRKQTAR